MKDQARRTKRKIKRIKRLSPKNAETLEPTGRAIEASSAVPAPPAVTKEDVGAKDQAFFIGLVTQVATATKIGEKIDEPTLKFTLGMMRHDDHLLAALRAHMALVHLQVMNFGARLAASRTEAELKMNEAVFTRLTRTFVAQLEAAKRSCGNSNPSPSVQNVCVAEGGQAIVGNVTQNTTPPLRAARSYRQFLVTARPVRRRRLWADGQSVWR
jgi:hypothetical protein